MEPWQERMLQQHDQDLYRGDAARPGLATRTLQNELDIKKMQDKEMQHTVNWRALLLMFAGTLLSALANLAVTWWRH
jgi:hypothetical protein